MSASYTARNGFKLLDATTPDGWTIRTAPDIVTALQAFPAFGTVAEAFIWEALDKATEARKEYADIKELAAYILQNYI